MSVESGTSDASGRPDDGEAEPAEETRRMRRAIAEIRREGWKVAVIYAAVDAALLTLLSNLLLLLFRPSVVPARIPLPPALVGVLRGTVGLALAAPSVGGGTVVAVALGVLVFGAEVVLRVRRPLVEQFEAANPGLRESLRTARDAVERGRDSRMARRLYEDVVTELRGASSVGLLDLRRLTATLLVVALVSLATVQVAVLDLSLVGAGGGTGAQPAGAAQPSDYGGLKDPSSVLGEPEDVPTGQASMDAVVDTSGSGSGNGADSAASYDNSGFTGTGSYESQRAAYSQGEQVEDADLVRRYNLKIRQEDDT